MDKFAPSLRSVGLLLAGAAIALAGLVIVHQLRRPAGPAPAPRPADPKPDDRPDWFGTARPAAKAAARSAPGILGGWRTDGGHKALAAAMPKLAQVAPHLMQARAAGDTRPILLYKAWTTLFANPPPYDAQTVGDCVGQGHGHAVDLLQCVEFALAHPGRKPTPADIQEVDTEWVYAASREITGQLGRFDGSYGAAAVKAMTEWGLVTRRMLGQAGAYDGRRARAWARSGVPDELKARAARFKLGAAAQVTRWEELEAAISAGHPVTICTAYGFELARDKDGFCRQLECWPMPNGCGGHCMFIAGLRYDRPGACIVQSWGPDTPGGPTSLDQPSFSFWADRDAVERILAEGDSWALSKAPHWGSSAARRRTIPAEWRKAG